jgi:hypothetical protein
VPFTFRYPSSITSRSANLTAFLLSGAPTAYIALGPGDFIAVGGPTPGFAREQEARYRRTGLPFMVRHETHSGLSMTVIDQVGATVADYFFNFGGGNWQIECSAFTQRVAIARACSQAVNSIR